MPILKIDPESTSLMREMQDSTRLDLFGIFQELSQDWLRRNPGKTGRDLAALLDARPQAVSQWRTGSDAQRRPPWGAILRLCHLCKKQVTISPRGIRLARLDHRTFSKEQ